MIDKQSFTPHLLPSLIPFLPDRSIHIEQFAIPVLLLFNKFYSFVIQSVKLVLEWLKVEKSDTYLWQASVTIEQLQPANLVTVLFNRCCLIIFCLFQKISSLKNIIIAPK